LHETYWQAPALVQLATLLGGSVTVQSLHAPPEAPHEVGASATQVEPLKQ